MEDAYIIKGGKRLNGTIKLSGAKNVALKVIIAALLFDQEVTLKNIPHIVDVQELLHLIQLLGAKAQFVEKNTVVVDGRSLNSNKVDFLHGSKIRVSFMLMVPLLHKFQMCYVPNPGGCRIGSRPIDRIIEGMKTLGAKVDYDSDTGFYEAELNDKPAGTYTFPKVTHTGTEFLILLSLFGKDRITLHNSAEEPETDNLILFLNQSGAKIERNGKKITIDPIKSLKRDNPFEILPDRNEAVTFAILALATKGEITISEISPSLLETFVKKIKEAGIGVAYTPKTMFRFYFKSFVKASHIETAPHPGFMTDWQPNWAVLMTQAQGESYIYERVFENRFSYVGELRKLGAEIEFVKIPPKDPKEYFFFNFDPNKKYNQGIKITGPQTLHGGVLNITDLRAGATLAIAGLVAQGESVINGASILERGYENFIDKVTSLGGDIQRA
ncbi:UDP-N-acetylglucosamine 1-carboxyvinyltransferase [Candidatus Roizmanbacteria bacterium]|nr:UDP-N-acetylglucosamine 1-carboxyvinyltransferase [Candidatus Roizmanbacteria bacterium]